MIPSNGDILLAGCEFSLAFLCIFRRLEITDAFVQNLDLGRSRRRLCVVQQDEEDAVDLPSNDPVCLRSVSAMPKDMILMLTNFRLITSCSHVCERAFG